MNRHAPQRPATPRPRQLEPPPGRRRPRLRPRPRPPAHPPRHHPRRAAPARRPRHHHDPAAGPAVFYALGTLTPGDTIGVHRDDGTTLDFTVHDVAVHDKDRLPERVYADTGNPELRVLTCGGTYHPDTGYTGNVVVYATLTGTR
ncbi:sortase domain-bontaining protein [Streptomyces sp. NPDC059853]|uniref:sortase domain-containing protein n=1 Tax=Streptomyces sp. NPDC059853 TaxID=3346973 RepID=UPI0036468E1D